MSKLHEILAVDGDLMREAQKIAAETIKTFSTKEHLFTGEFKTLEMFDEGRKKEEEGQQTYKEMTTTVQEKLDYTTEALIQHLDCLSHKEHTNQETCADVVVNGNVILSKLPATLLLSIENKLAAWRNIYEAIPTLKPGIEWALDDTNRLGSFKAVHDELSHKTEMTIQHKILVNPTKEHPAQVEKWTEQKPVGQYRKVLYSGMITPTRKSQLLRKVDVLAQAVKQARQRANTADVIKANIGGAIFKFIHA